MSKVQFIPNPSKEILLFPSRIDEDIADDAPVRIIDHVLDKIDISNILKLYHVKGRNAFYPRMMLKVIIYAYMTNIYSCRRIEELLKRDIHFIWLAGYNKPDFITIMPRPQCKDKWHMAYNTSQLLECGYHIISIV